VFQIQPAATEIQIIQSLRRFAQPVQPVHLLRFLRHRSARFVSLLFEATRLKTPRLRNFDTEPPSSYCYEFRSDNRLESVANAHTAADLHVRPVSKTALVIRTVGAANALRDTSCLISRNENDST
jgi:hypothetical protein